MNQPYKARSVEKTMEDFRKDLPGKPESEYALVRQYILDARTEIILEKAERVVAQRSLTEPNQ